MDSILLLAITQTFFQHIDLLAVVKVGKRSLVGESEKGASAVSVTPHSSAQ